MVSQILEALWTPNMINTKKKNYIQAHHGKTTITQRQSQKWQEQSKIRS